MKFIQTSLDDLESGKTFSEIVASQNAAEVPSETIDTRDWADQLRAVYEVMKDGRPRTLELIAHHANALPQSASARIRELKNLKGIPYKKWKPKGTKLFLYKLLPHT